MRRVYAVVASKRRINDDYDDEIGQLALHRVVNHCAGEQQANVDGCGNVLEGIAIVPIAPDNPEASTDEITNAADQRNIGVVFDRRESKRFVVESQK